MKNNFLEIKTKMKYSLEQIWEMKNNELETILGDFFNDEQKMKTRVSIKLYEENKLNNNDSNIINNNYQNYYKIMKKSESLKEGLNKLTLKLKPNLNVAIELYNSNNSKKWMEYYKKYDKTIELISIAKNKPQLIELDKWLWNDLKNDVHNRSEYYLTKEELSNIMKWKLMRGKFRPLQKMVDENSSEFIKLCTNNAFNILEDNWKNALKELMKLKGIGVATASIILSVFCPNHFPFMSDEVIESVHDGKKYYTNSVYFSIQSKLENKKNELNNNGKKWNLSLIYYFYQNYLLKYYTYVIFHL